MIEIVVFNHSITPYNKILPLHIVFLIFDNEIN